MDDDSNINRLFFVGFMGSGKTTKGKRIASKYGLRFIDLDEYIEDRTQHSISQIFADKGESGFRLIEQKMLKEVAQYDKVLVAAGGGTPCFFDNMEVMNNAGVTVYLKATAEDLSSYLLANGTSKRPLVRDKSPEELLSFIRQSLEKREPFYEKAQYTMTSDDTSDVLFDALFS